MAKQPKRINIHVYGTDSKHSLLEFSRFLYHLDLTYEISRLATDSKYGRYVFPKHTFRPTVSPLEPDDQMLLSRVLQASPWELSVSLNGLVSLLTGGLGAVLLFVRVFERLSTGGVNRQKLHLGVEKLRRELEESERKGDLQQRGPDMLDGVAEGHLLTSEQESMRLYRRLQRRGAERFYESNINSIRRLGVEVRDFDIEITRHMDIETPRRKFALKQEGG